MNHCPGCSARWRRDPNARAPRVLLWALLLAPLLGVAPAHARDIGGTHLSWWACPGDTRAAPGVPFDCIAEGGTVYTLIGTFTLDSEVPNAVSMDADVNVAFPEQPSVPSFWEVDPGGCNPASFGLVKGMPEGCGEHLNAFCHGDTNLCDLLYSALVVPGTNVLRLSITVGRGFLHTAQLHAGQRYFAFAINIPMLGSASCIGCSQPSAIGFSQGTIYSLDALGQLVTPVTVSGSYPSANACATANDGYSECVTVPVRRLSWGRLKSLYR